MQELRDYSNCRRVYGETQRCRGETARTSLCLYRVQPCPPEVPAALNRVLGFPKWGESLVLRGLDLNKRGER